ncbi:MAG TPA: hypothetical protein VE870_06595 [Bacteroidales bacterium]|nr:hypothetical protein [Bacteroidales bacterium]
MKKFSLILVFLSFFAFVSLNSCKQNPKTSDQTEEMAPAEEQQMTPAEEDTTAPAEMQEDTSDMGGGSM